VKEETAKGARGGDARPGFEGVESAFKAKTARRSARDKGGFEHESSDKVVS